MRSILTNGLFQSFLLLGLLCVSIAFNFSDTRWREQIRNFTFDNYNLMKPRLSSGAALIVDIDEASLKKIGQMPWPRDVMADLVVKLNEMGAKVIVFDIVFSEPDRSSPLFIAQTLGERPEFADLTEKIQALPDNDALLGEAIKNAGNVVTGFSFTNEKTQAVPVQKGIFRGKNIENYVPSLAGATINLRQISKDAAGSGSFFVSTDTDGIIRRVPMLVAHKRPDSNIVSIYPSLALEAVRVYEGERGGTVKLADERYARLDPNRFGVESIEIGKDKRSIPTNARGEFLVYFAKSSRDWYVPAHSILEGTYPADMIKDKVVLIGTSAVGLKDIRSTPLDTFIPGAEVHLNIIDQILQGEFLSRPIEAEGAEAISILLVGLFIIAFSPFIGAAMQALVVTLVITGAIFAGSYVFSAYGLLIDITYPSFCVLAIFMLSTILTYLRTEKERRAVRQAFGLYISPDFMKELTANPDKLRLGGENRELTVMFTDVRKFTTISEGMKPEELIQLMNDFLTPMSDLVMQNRGTIDKYIGDAMMAFWNAPLDDQDHARHACKTALGMQTALEPVNAAIAQRARAKGTEPALLKIGIGINTGICAVGNMGSRQRFAYSVLGDTVNLASRLEGQTKTYHVGAIIGENTREQVKDFALLELDLVQVKGRARPVRIFALLGDEKLAAENKFIELKTAHEKMITSYQSGDFAAALKVLKECDGMQDFDLAAMYGVYKERIRELADNPPASWDGVYVAKNK
ncbi:MAG: adenylate/guanylate cyclase domain-containing protein [Alphaproteobacteria bacterium]